MQALCIAFPGTPNVPPWVHFCCRSTKSMLVWRQIYKLTSHFGPHTTTQVSLALATTMCPPVPIAIHAPPLHPYLALLLTLPPTCLAFRWKGADIKSGFPRAEWQRPCSCAISSRSCEQAYGRLGQARGRGGDRWVLGALRLPKLGNRNLKVWLVALKARRPNPHGL